MIVITRIIVVNYQFIKPIFLVSYSISIGSVSLPLQRSCTNDLPMTPPFGKDSLDSRDSFSFDTYLPPTPKSTMTFQVENILNILNDGPKAEAANTFIMTKAIETTLKISTTEKSIWNICSKESSWWEKTCDYFKVPEKVIL